MALVPQSIRKSSTLLLYMYLSLADALLAANRSRSSWRHTKYLKSDVDSTTARFVELKATGNQDAMKEWRGERVQYVKERKEVSVGFVDSRLMPDAL